MSATAAQDPQPSPSLLRALGPGMAVAIVVGNVIGSGIFAKPGQIAADGRNFTLIIAAWVTGGVLSLLGGLCFAELAAMMPRAGGMYEYLKQTYGRPFGYLQGWSQFVFGNPGSLGALSIFFVVNLEELTGQEISDLATLGLSVLLIAGLAGINMLGVLWGGWTQGVTTLIKAGFVAMVAVLPYIVAGLVGDQPGGFDAGLYAQGLPVDDTTPSVTTRFAVVLLAVMWAYNGWHGITPVAEEVRDPGRNIPRSLIIGIVILTVLYVSANVAYHAVVPMEEMVRNSDNREKVALLMCKSLLGPVGGTLMALGVMISTFGAINSNLLLGPRVPFAMGRDDSLLAWMGTVHPRRRTPARAIAVQATMGVLLLCSAAVLVRVVPSLKNKTIFELMTNYIVFSSSIFYMLTVLAVPVLRRLQPDAERPFRVPLVIPVAYLLFYTWFLYHVLIEKPFESIIGLLMNLSGLPVLLIGVWWAKRNAHQQEPTS